MGVMGEGGEGEGVEMKIITWNVRGLGGFEKRKEVRSLIQDKCPFILCLQETKLQVCDSGFGTALWGNQDVSFSFRSSIGALGGLLTVWDTSEVEVRSTVSFNHTLVIHGQLLKSNEEFYLFNVYAPCDARDRKLLWDSLFVCLQQLQGKMVCVCGDFNDIRIIEERRSVSVGQVAFNFTHFNSFIDNNFLVDLPLGGRKFTWFKGDRKSMSRLDRFLLSEDWCLVWPNCLQIAQMRGLSDHCPVILSVDEENWGPRPTRLLKCWTDVPGYKEFVSDKWKFFQVNGWGGFVLKEKFKLIKLALKEWHASHTQNLSGKISALKDRLASLDEKGEITVLTEEESAEMHGVSSDIHSLSRLNTSICWQQSRVKWLQDGDANSKKFHSVMANRRRRNTLCSILVDGVLVEGVHPIREAVFENFKNHFRSNIVERPSIANLQFKTLSIEEGVGLIKPFSLVEIKEAVWDCDSYKSPGPDGINFGFIKEFWLELKDEIF